MGNRLTKELKEEIVKGFQAGKPSTKLAKDYACTPATIIRVVKASLTEDEYLKLKNSNSKRKSLAKNKKPVDDKNINKKVPESLGDKNQPVENLTLNVDTDFPVLESTNLHVFTEIAPLNSDNSWDHQKEVACIPINSCEMPKILYMVVDKKVELESRQLKEFAEWEFLPDEDQNRYVIPLFSSQREAKKICSKNQRVLKVPDSKLFILSAPYLLKKGITRLILDDSIIALDLA